MPEKYDDVLLPFLTLMRRELHANSRKGDRPGWLRMDPNTALLEVYWHTAKLSAAVKNNDGPAIMEHAADVANMAMMVLDVCGGLAFVDGVETGEPRGPVHSCKNCAHLSKGSCDEPCAGCTVRWRSGVSDRWEPAPGMAPSAGARPLSEWHEDDGPVTWWKFPVDEPAWIGTPNSSDWPGYHTHWTPHPPMPLGVQVAHTDHPLRHYDRTCPACAAGVPLIDAADHVMHGPTGETWVVARVNGNHLHPCGWPPTRADLSDCTLVKKATLAEREQLLRDLSQGQTEHAGWAADTLGVPTCAGSCCDCGKGCAPDGVPVARPEGSAPAPTDRSAE